MQKKIFRISENFSDNAEKPRITSNISRTGKDFHMRSYGQNHKSRFRENHEKPQYWPVFRDFPENLIFFRIIRPCRFWAYISV